MRNRVSGASARHCLLGRNISTGRQRENEELFLSIYRIREVVPRCLLSALNLNAAQDLLAESSGHAKALFGARDLHELQSLQGSLLQPGVEKSVSYLRAIQEISRGVQEQLHSAIETQFSALQKQAD